MSKEQWFQNYETLYNEREAGEMSEELTDEDLAEMASERERDQEAERADRIHDERKHEMRLIGDPATGKSVMVEVK